MELLVSYGDDYAKTPRHTGQLSHMISPEVWELFNPTGPGTLGFIDPRNGVKDIKRDWMVKVCLIPCALPSSLLLIF